MDARNVAHWGTLSMVALFAVTGLEVRTAAPVTDVTATETAKTVDIQMIGDATGYRFAPATVTIQRGDKVRFSLVSGPPHNVVFWADSVPKGAAGALAKGMPKTVDALTSPFFLNAGDSYVVSFAGAPAGRYVYNCAPHLALGMKAVIVVK
jgi:plastocyanin